MACSSGEEQVGFTKRRRDVIIPTRGEGKCAEPDSHFRLENKGCNTQSCEGSEECFAIRDLVLNVDGGGSITEENFDILKEFVVKLVSRFKGEVRESELMRPRRVGAALSASHCQSSICRTLERKNIWRCSWAT